MNIYESIYMFTHEYKLLPTVGLGRMNLSIFEKLSYPNSTQFMRLACKIAVVLYTMTQRCSISFYPCVYQFFRVVKLC